jgi:ATP-dependent helicase/nuclease subunit A
VPVILNAVDRVFAAAAAHAGLTTEPGPTVHTAHRRDQPGRVVVWPAIKPPDQPRPSDWATPVDHLGEDSPEVQLAKRIGATIKGWLDRGDVLDAPAPDGKPRPIRAGEILVLVRTRGALADAINRQLKTRGVPIAGSDRLALTEHIAVMDLMALARVALTPEDDLSLAAVLKSPLLGLDESTLFELAHKRGARPLWTALKDAAEPGGELAAAKAQIDKWRSMADTHDPHAFFARILAGDRGRRAFLTRLGPEAQDVLDEFLGEALRYEESNTPSLEGFLAWLDESETEIKRDTDARDEVRVMTVHGAKGLEADVVFLVDNGMAPWLAMHDPKLLPLDEGDDPESPGPLVWNRSIKAMPKAIRLRVDRWRETSAEEYRRLLYVGMTRARDRLYIVGIDKRTPKDDDRRWHAIVRRGLDDECQEYADETGATVLEWRPEPRSGGAAAIPPPAAPISPPDWLWRPPPAAPATRRLTPSTVGEQAPAAQAFSVSAGPESRRRGVLVHRLLQSLPDLPPGVRAATARQYLTAHAIAEEDAEPLLQSVLAILDHSAFAEVFAPGSRAEVELAGRIETAAGPATVSGRIDRLAVTPARILIADYKTNRSPPTRVDAVPRGYVNQLALYRLVLRKLYPERSVAAALLWTQVPALMELPAEALDAAEALILRGSAALPVQP